MAVTRDRDFPVEAAQLVQAFNRCADGHSMEHVIQAAANMLSAALHNYARAKKMNRAEAIEFFTDTMKRTQTNAEMNFDREGRSLPGDVTVKAN